MSLFKKSQSSTGWYAVSGSCTGKSHVEKEIICQDAHHVEDLGGGWILTIVCDGAGSATHSHLGAAFIAKIAAPELFRHYLDENNLKNFDSLPTEDDWRSFCIDAYREMYIKIVDYAKSLELETKDLACTVIASIISPMGLLVTHIGDGRAGYRTKNGKWYASITPHKGEEANHTIFLTSRDWQQNDLLEMSDVTVPESRVILDNIDAFTLMSDGCENHSFLCSVMDVENQKWEDPNQPYERFFTPLINSLTGMTSNETSIDDANEIWKLFLERGTTGLANELDDKTMILGITF